MSVVAVLRSRAFWTWYLFVAMIVATAAMAAVLHQLIGFAPPDPRLTADLMPAFTRLVIERGMVHAGVIAGLAVAAAIGGVAVHFTRGSPESRQWAMLAIGGLATVMAAFLFCGHVVGVYVLPAAKLAAAG